MGASKKRKGQNRSQFGTIQAAKPSSLQPPGSPRSPASAGGSSGETSGSEDAAPLQKTGHVVGRAELKGVPGYFKENKHGNPLLSELEVAFSAIWHVFLPDNTPGQTLLGTDDEGNVTGVYSQGIEGFEPFEDLEKKTLAAKSPEERKRLIKKRQSNIEGLKTPQQYLDEGLMEILVVAEFLQEDDLHRGNIGTALVEGERRVCKIDHDESFYSILLSALDLNLRKIPILGLLLHFFSDKKRLKLKDNSIETWPAHPDDEGPHYTPTIYRHFGKTRHRWTREQVKAVSRLQHNEKAIKIKYDTLLGILLVDEKLFNDALKIQFSEDSIAVVGTKQAVLTLQEQHASLLFHDAQFLERLLKPDEGLLAEITNVQLKAGDNLRWHANKQLERLDELLIRANVESYLRTGEFALPVTDDENSIPDDHKNVCAFLGNNKALLPDGNSNLSQMLVKLCIIYISIKNPNNSNKSGSFEIATDVSQYLFENKQPKRWFWQSKKSLFKIIPADLIESSRNLYKVLNRDNKKSKKELEILIQTLILITKHKLTDTAKDDGELLQQLQGYENHKDSDVVKDLLALIESPLHHSLAEIEQARSPRGDGKSSAVQTEITDLLGKVARLNQLAINDYTRDNIGKMISAKRAGLINQLFLNVRGNAALKTHIEKASVDELLDILKVALRKPTVLSIRNILDCIPWDNVDSMVRIQLQSSSKGIMSENKVPDALAMAIHFLLYDKLFPPAQARTASQGSKPRKRTSPRKSKASDQKLPESLLASAEQYLEVIRKIDINNSTHPLINLINASHISTLLEQALLENKYNTYELVMTILKQSTQPNEIDEILVNVLKSALIIINSDDKVLEIQDKKILAIRCFKYVLPEIQTFEKFKECADLVEDVEQFGFIKKLQSSWLIKLFRGDSGVTSTYKAINLELNAWIRKKPTDEVESNSVTVKPIQQKSKVKSLGLFGLFTKPHEVWIPHSLVNIDGATPNSTASSSPK